MTFFYRLCTQSFSTIAKLLYQHKVEGLENWVPGGAIIAANHSSYLDPLLIAASLPEKVFFIAKAPLFRFPFFSACLRLLDTIALDQKDANGLEMGFQKLKEGKKVVIFPEGERSYDGKLLPFKEGAASLSLRSEKPILPIYIGGAHATWPRGKRLPHLSGKTFCRIGKPLYPQNFSHLSPKHARKELTSNLYDILSKER